MASSRSSRANKCPTSPIFNFTQISLHLIILFLPRSHIFLHTPLSLSLKQISHFPSYSYVSLALSLSLTADAPRSRWSKAPITHGRTDFSSDLEQERRIFLWTHDTGGGNRNPSKFEFEARSSRDGPWDDVQNLTRDLIERVIDGAAEIFWELLNLDQSFLILKKSKAIMHIFPRATFNSRSNCTMISILDNSLKTMMAKICLYDWNKAYV